MWDVLANVAHVVVVVVFLAWVIHGLARSKK